MNEISIKSPEYQSMELLLTKKSPFTRRQQSRERDGKESLDLHSAQASQQQQSTLEKPRTGSSVKISSKYYRFVS